MKPHLAPVSVVTALLVTLPSLTTGCSTDVDDLDDVDAAQTEQEVAVAIPIGTCLASPPCAAAVAAALGYVVYSVSQLSGEALNRAQRAANDWARSQQRNRYLCTARCQANGAPGGAYYVEGTSTVNCSSATAAAKASVPRGQYPRHCSCSDTRGFRGTGTQCENHR